MATWHALKQGKDSRLHSIQVQLEDQFSNSWFANGIFGKNGEPIPWALLPTRLQESCLR